MKTPGYNIINHRTSYSATSFRMPSEDNAIMGHLCNDMHSPQNLFEENLHVFCQSSAAALHILENIDETWQVQLDYIEEGGYAIDVEEKIVWLDNGGLMPDAFYRSTYFVHNMQINFLRALRDIWHHEEFGDDYDHFTIDAILMAERLKSADIECFVIDAIFEICELDIKSHLWAHVMAAESGDMAIIFSRALEQNNFSISPKDYALQQAFQQWYKDPARVAACDHRSLEEIDCLIEWDKDLFMRRCQSLKSQKMCQMTQRINGSGSYLGNLNLGFLKDPSTHDINDTVNRVHLMHIMRDLETTQKGDVAFRSKNLANKIFPEYA